MQRDSVSASLKDGLGAPPVHQYGLDATNSSTLWPADMMAWKMKGSKICWTHKGGTCEASRVLLQLERQYGELPPPSGAENIGKTVKKYVSASRYIFKYI